MENLTISKDNAIKAFDEATTKGKLLLENLFGKKVFVKNIMERIKTLDDALEYNGKTKEQFAWETERDSDAQKADKELEEIAVALREGKPLEMGQKWYYPYFRKPTGSSSSFSCSGCDCGCGSATVGARHSVDTAEKAIYLSSEQFANIHNRRLAPSR